MNSVAIIAKETTCDKCNHINKYLVFSDPEKRLYLPYLYNEHLFREMGETIIQQQKLIEELLKR